MSNDYNGITIMLHITIFNNIQVKPLTIVLLVIIY